MIIALLPDGRWIFKDYGLPEAPALEGNRTPGRSSEINTLIEKHGFDHSCNGTS